MGRKSLLVFLISYCSLGASSPPDYSEAILCPARPCPSNIKNIQGSPKIKGSFLFWQCKETGLEFASQSDMPSTTSSPTQTFRQKLFIPDFAWHPGVKVELGYNLPYDGWDIVSKYTFYESNFTSLKKHIHSQIAPSGLGVIPLWHYPFINFSSTSDPLRFRNAAGNWRLHFNTVDVELGREYFILNSLPMRMHLGIKASWISQFYHVNYSQGTTITGVLLDLTQQTLNYNASKMKFSSGAWGLGPRTGIESKWNLGWNISLIADATLSLLCTFTEIHTKYADELVNVATSAALPNRLFMKEHFREITPVLEGRLGFDWGTCFCRSGRPVYFGLTIAYEAQYWWSQNHVRRNFPFNAPGNMWDMRGELQLQGLTASLRVDY